MSRRSNVTRATGKSSVGLGSTLPDNDAPRPPQWLLDSRPYEAKRWQLCPDETSNQSDVSPFNLLEYLTHLKSRVGPTAFRNVTAKPAEANRSIGGHWSTDPTGALSPRAAWRPRSSRDSQGDSQASTPASTRDGTARQRVDPPRDDGAPRGLLHRLTSLLLG